jgi:hypothetical protein
LPLKSGKKLLILPIKTSETSPVLLADLVSNPYFHIPTTSTSTAGACARAESEVDQSQTDDNFTDFLSVYPFDPTRMSVGAAREAFDELSIEDQLKAVRFAKPYATAIKAHNRNFPVNAAKWLSERRFDEIERILIAKAQAGGLKDEPLFVARGTEAWSACAAEFRRTKGKDPPQVEHDGQTGWWFSSLSSPGCHPDAPMRRGKKLGIRMRSNFERDCALESSPLETLLSEKINAKSKI